MNRVLLDEPCQKFLPVGEQKVIENLHFQFSCKDGPYVHNMMVLLEALNQNKMPKAEDIISGKETPETIRPKLKSSGAGKCKRANCCRK